MNKIQLIQGELLKVNIIQQMKKKLYATLSSTLNHLSNFYPFFCYCTIIYHLFILLNHHKKLSKPIILRDQLWELKIIKTLRKLISNSNRVQIKQRSQRSSMKQKYFQKRNRKQKPAVKESSPEEDQSQIQFNEELLARFQNFMSNQKFKKLKIAMANYIGRNTPINYQPDFAFQEHWQNKRKSNSKSFRDFLHSHNSYLQVSALFLLIGYCVLVWFVSFDLVFHTGGPGQAACFDSIGLIVILMHVAMKIVFHLRLYPGQYANMDYVKIFYLDFIIFVYFLVRVFVFHQMDRTQTLWTIGVDVFFIVNGYRRGAEIYKSFRMKIITSIYKDFFNLFDLLATSLIVAHLFALMLYLAGSSGISPKSWMKVAQIDDEGPYTLYLYSLYFACTTMLTVGYGDLAPSNVLEIVTVLMIEIFGMAFVIYTGIAIFAYVINEIGHTLSSMRKQNQTLEKDLSTLSKVSKYYELDEQLQIKARSFIIDNKTSISDLLPQEQKQLLMKLNDELRTEINQENSLKIIKSSIFFICHWSKKMQFETAKKLTKKLYSPNEKLLQTPGKQAIYVIRKGKVDIYTDRHSGLKRHFKKMLKSIEVQDAESVAHNVYGYTTVVSSRPIRLNAIAKDFTVVYSLQKNDFIQSIMDNELDFQYYHEIKCRIDLEKMPQAYEAPAILNIREHYRPNIFFVIKKSKKRYLRNRRIQYLRDQTREQKRRMKVVLYDSLQQLQGEIDYPSKMFNSSYEQMLKTKTMTDHVMAYFTEEHQNKKILHNTFDAFKQYENYFKKFNLNRILCHQQNENFGADEVKIKQETIKTLKTLKDMKKRAVMREGIRYKYLEGEDLQTVEGCKSGVGDV